MKKNIAIVAGGYSSEIEISLKSADGLYTYIDKEKYQLFRVIIEQSGWSLLLKEGERLPINKNDFSFVLNGEKVQIHYAYITIHGTPGEDGKLQGYFDMLGIPYSTCGVLASSLTFDKYVCGRYLSSLGILVPNARRLHRGAHYDADQLVASLGLPLFVKPNDGGSSFGITKVKHASEIEGAIAKAFNEGDQVILEEAIQGREVTCGCYKVKEKAVVLPISEVVTTNEFFDFAAKYQGKAEEITPARLDEELTKKIQSLTLAIYELIGARGIIRIDYIITAEGTPCLLEVNTTPGMTKASFIPQQIAAAGLDITQVLTEIIDNE